MEDLNSKKARILVVEDESLIALIIRQRLESLGYRVVAMVDSAEQAIQETEAQQPDLILMDIKLRGEMDGIEAAEIIHDRHHLPVIFLTAYADEETLQRARVAEPFGFLLKPFEEHSLVPAIEMALYKHKMEQALRESEVHYRSLELQTRDLLEQVQSLARRDSLTNLFNHRYFYELAELEFAKSKRYQHALAAIMIDLDYFKEINDTYGHLVGDQALRIVADRLTSNLRAFDILGRVGGDEFLALLPETSAAEAVRVAERLSDCIKEDFIAGGRQNIHVTASLGVAVNTEPCPDLEGLIHRADQAMYAAKHAGRDRVNI